MDVSNANASATPAVTEDTGSEPTVNSGADIDLETVFEEETSSPVSTVSSGEITGAHGYLSRLDHEAKLEKFFSKPEPIRKALREKFPEEYPQEDFGESGIPDTQDNISKIVEEEIQKRKSLEDAGRSKQEAKEMLDSFFQNAGEEFTILHSKEFLAQVKNAYKENKGIKPRDAIRIAIGDFAVQGKYIPKKALEDAEIRGKIAVGQELPKQTSTKAESPMEAKLKAEIERSKSTLPSYYQNLLNK